MFVDAGVAVAAQHLATHARHAFDVFRIPLGFQNGDAARIPDGRQLGRIDGSLHG